MENVSSSKPRAREFFVAGCMLLACFGLLLMDSQADSAASLKAQASSQAQQAIIVDHTTTDLDQVPQYWIDQAEAQLNIYYGHTSHGSQPVSGMDALGIGTLTMYEYGDDLGHNGDTSWVAPTRSYLDSPPETNVVVWSWCGGVSDNTEAGINAYLDAMSGLEADYPDVTFVYMTGHLDGTGVAGNLYARNNQIRAYCAANDKVLYDFADIESYDPEGTFYPDEDDSCSWCYTWCAAHPDDCTDLPGSCAHSHGFNCLQKGKAFWWMAARLSGWDGEASATTYYVRPDGGSAEECTGLVDAPYPGSGTGQPCAWDHPFRALPPGDTPRIAGGDTLIIGAGSYMMGYGAPGADNCESDYPWDCYVPPIPSGPDAAHPTRILGAGWDSGCSDPPELWGTQRPWFIVNLTDASNVEVACLEITDHSDCVESHTGGLACERESYPFGPWAAIGLYAEDSANVYLHHLNIHGLASGGVHAGRLTDWTVEDVRIAGNGWVGWEGDIDGDDSNSGTMTFRRWTVEWNGCGETYPGEEPTGCWAQTAGGYGDGVGTGATGGDWIIEDSAFLHNTSDGLDLLYHSLGGSITINRVRAEGNAGNQIKVTGQTTLVNSVLVGNCAFFEGQPFTYDVDNCRALGNTLELSFMGGETVSVINNTLYGQGDGLVGAGSREGYSCDSSEVLFGRNNIFLGDWDWNALNDDPPVYDRAFLFYYEECADLSFDSDYSVLYNTKHSLYTPGANDIQADPKLAGSLSGQRYGMELTADSPAIDAGTASGAPAVDIHGNPRPLDGDSDEVAVVDIGADEFTFAGDLDYDCDVDIADIMLVASLWHTTVGDLDFNPAYDLDADGDIDIVDIMLVAVNWGKEC